MAVVTLVYFHKALSGIIAGRGRLCSGRPAIPGNTGGFIGVARLGTGNGFCFNQLSLRLGDKPSCIIPGNGFGFHGSLGPKPEAAWKLATFDARLGADFPTFNGTRAAGRLQSGVRYAGSAGAELKFKEDVCIFEPRLKLVDDFCPMLF